MGALLRRVWVERIKIIVVIVIWVVVLALLGEGRRRRWLKLITRMTSTSLVWRGSRGQVGLWLLV